MDVGLARALLTHAPFGELLEMLDGVPLLVLHMDDCQPQVVAELADRARGLPLVTVGIGGAGRVVEPQLDLLLTAVPGLGEPWVHVTDPVQCARQLADTVRQHPHACTTLTSVLRITEPLDVPEAIAAESMAYSTLLAGPEFARWVATRPPRKYRKWHEPPVRVARSPSEVRITLTRPENRNAVSAQMRDALVDVLTPLAADASAMPVVLDALGPDFSAGGDLNEFGSAPDPATAHLTRTSHSVGKHLHIVAERTTALLHGACIGAGIEIPAFAATVRASENTCFQLPEIEIGLIPGAGGTISIPRRIGRHRTAYLALSAERISAPTALEWGLIDEILPSPDRVTEGPRAAGAGAEAHKAAE